MRRRRSRGETSETGSRPLSRLVPDADVEPALRSVARRGGRLAAWSVVLASPLVTLLALILLRPTPSAAPSADERSERDPRGWAEMYVRAWLSVSRDDPASLETFYPPGMKSQRAVGSQVPVDLATLTATSPSTGVWSVVVAVNLLTQQPEGKRIAKLVCVQVSMLESPAEPGAYVAAALPSPVACPATLGSADLAYPETAELTGPIGQSVLGFLTAYLAGQGSLDRYTAPGTSLAPTAPAPYVAVQLSSLRTHEKFEPGQAARPLDGTATRLAESMGVRELKDLGHIITNAGQGGASIVDTLRAKASSLAQQQLAAQKAGSSIRSDRMDMPVAVMGLAFIGFLAFPCIYTLLGG
ncbi:Conjugative transposon protein TcpC [Amycolatopsis xylanica]|uniref:Conjugative transposon protein TcpC n=1 Tax=Amycolatopsis xylanica TaxID=589385 RepID=A0A1H3S3V4_9PSEU|nr:conjugal transfer protein [Amycolatopsis xylanica]SDZ32490.1 Conjugative transposon protein TcpC [Amycolatopsis xylanica]